MDFFIYEPPLDPLSILYVDQDILVVDKPSGLLSVPGKSLEHRDCLETRVRTQFNGVLLVISCGRVVRDFEREAKTRCNF